MLAVLKQASQRLSKDYLYMYMHMHVYHSRLGALQSEDLAEAAVVRTGERGHAYDAVARHQLPLAVLAPSRAGAGAAQRQAAVTPLDALARREEYPAWRVRSEREGAVPDDKLDAERGGRPVLVAGLRHGQLHHHHFGRRSRLGVVTRSLVARRDATARRTNALTPNLQMDNLRPRVLAAYTPL